LSTLNTLLIFTQDIEILLKSDTSIDKNASFFSFLMKIKRILE
jgi:hypothetical protein